MNDLNNLKKLKNRCKTITLVSIFSSLILTALAIVYFVVIIGDQTIDVYLTIGLGIGLIIISVAIGLYCFILQILIIVSSSSLIESKNKILYLIMAILGMFLIGIIGYIVIWISANSEINDIKNNPSDYDGSQNNRTATY